MKDCLFCKIASGVIQAQLAHQDDQCVAFHDLNPQSPTHILVIPRRHLSSIAECEPADEPLLGHLQLVAANLARKLGFEKSGYRMVLNTGPDGGQTVQHIHVHLLAGRALQWPPG